MNNDTPWYVAFMNELDKNNKKEANTVSNVVAQYREDIGLDMLIDAGDVVVKMASLKNKSLSKRASEKEPIQNRQDVKEIIHSFCQNSGGTKSIYSILDYLRKKLGNENISYSDKELLDYIKEVKNSYQSADTAIDSTDVGLVGTEMNNDDLLAEYATRGTKS